MAGDDKLDPHEIDRLAFNHVRAGFLDRDAIVERIVDALKEDIPIAKLRLLVVRATDDAIAEQVRAQSAWPPLTDCDRLDLAFDQLEDGGILARHNFTCCAQCGSAEMAAEADLAEQRGLIVRGYVFYHQQDTERALEGQGLGLTYGAVDDSNDSVLAVAREIVARLQACGLAASWDGDGGARIAVPLEWRRRFADM